MKGYAILIGINDADKTHYHDSKNWCGAAYDTKAILDILNSTKLYLKENILHRNEKTTQWDRLLKDAQELQSRANNEPTGAFVFLYFSGHGAYLDNLNKELLCFYDRMVFEEEIRAFLAGFNEKCKLFVVLDACYSGGIAGLKSIQKRYKAIENSQDIYELYRDRYNSILEASLQMNQEIKAETFYLLACGKREQTLMGANCESNSSFTKTLIYYWESLKSDHPDYVIFYHHFTSRPGNTVNIKHINRNSDFFFTTYPLIFNSIVMEATIDLNEIDEKPVLFRITPNTAPFMQVTNSVTYERSHLLFPHYITLVEARYGTTLTNGVEFISHATLEQTGDSNVFKELTFFFSKDPCGTSNGLVITTDPQGGLWHKPKRTSGRVSNKLG